MSSGASPARLFTAVLLGLGGPAGCAHLAPTAASSGPAQRLAGPCPGGHDYGSGMVALGLPPDAHRAFALVHESLVAETAGLALSEGDDARPFAPHISLVYGVDEGNREAISAVLGRQASLVDDVPLKVEDLALWELGEEGSAVLVATLADSSGRLAALHRCLQPLTGAEERYPYRPHVSLAYFRGGARPSADTLVRLGERLAGLDAKLRVAWLTDRCGTPIGYEALGCSP